MENITIPVPPFIAKQFAKANVAEKRKAEAYINAWLADFFSNRPANENLFKLMKRGTAEGKASGLTPNKLEELFNDDE